MRKQSSNWSYWVQTFRPKTLTAAIVPVFVGTAVAIKLSGEYKPWVTGLCLLGALFIQIATNLFNDALDFKKGADHAGRLGPSRATQMGWLTEKQVIKASAFALFAALAVGVPLVLEGGWPILLIGLVSLFLAYGYTGGPFPLAYLGLGDLFVILFFGVIAVSGTYYLHTLSFSFSSAVAGLQIGLLATVLIAINNLRDARTDAEVRKLTLAVRLGEKWSKREIIFLLIVTQALGSYWWAIGEKAAAVLPLAVLPMSIRLSKTIWSAEPSSLYNRFLAQAALIHLLFGLLFCMGLLGGW